MISQTAEYALRAIVFLASREGAPQVTAEIAEVTRVPAGYLAKVLQNLGRGGLVKSQRGIHGGFVLARDPGSISVLEVINAVDPIKRIHECPLGLEQHGTNLCPLHRKLDDAMALIEKTFGDYSVADLLAEPTASHPMALCPQAEKLRQQFSQ
jgi:Rrf2 family protein